MIMDYIILQLPFQLLRKISNMEEFCKTKGTNSKNIANQRD